VHFLYVSATLRFKQAAATRTRSAAFGFRRRAPIFISNFQSSIFNASRRRSRRDRFSPLRSPLRFDL
jgi:hypothetical protein